MRICVVGIGRMGLAVATHLASSGATVLGADINASLVDAVNAGTVDVSDEPGLGDLLASGLKSGNLRATTDTVEAVRASDAVIVLVRMVAGADGQPEYGPLDAATASIAAGLQRGTVVIYETTLPVGDTRRRFAPALTAGSGLSAGSDFHVCFSPERVSSGSILRDLRSYPKLVGGMTNACGDAGFAVYRAHLGADVWRMSSLEAAEFAKVAETTYRDVNIALANEFARFADEIGVDFAEVARAANSQPYSHLHQAGIGVGGHCIPVYPHFFMARAAASPLISTARCINNRMPAYSAERLGRLLGGLDGRRVLILGLAFRGNVSEWSHSMAFPLHAALTERGAEVRVHDPVLGREAVQAHGFLWDEPTSGFAEGMVLQAAHDEYADLRPETTPGLRAILDGRMLLDPAVWKLGGIAFAGIGR